MRMMTANRQEKVIQEARYGYTRPSDDKTVDNKMSFRVEKRMKCSIIGRYLLRYGSNTQWRWYQRPLCTNSTVEEEEEGVDYLDSSSIDLLRKIGCYKCDECNQVELNI